jgi:hypothetical protein
MIRVDNVEDDDMTIAKTEFYINTTGHILALDIPDFGKTNYLQQ